MICNAIKLASSSESEIFKASLTIAIDFWQPDTLQDKTPNFPDQLVLEDQALMISLNGIINMITKCNIDIIT